MNIIYTMAEPVVVKAIVLYVGLSEQEARKSAPMYGQCACYSYEAIDKGDTAELSDEKWEWDYWPE